jgi:transposase
MAAKNMTVDRDEFVKLYLAGAKERHLAEQFGVSRIVIKQELQRRGLHRGLDGQALFEWRQHTDLTYADVARLYLSGDSEKQLADRCHVARSVIRRILLLQGVTPRDQSESEALKWSRMTDDVRDRQVAAAHAAVLGSTRSLADLINRALGIQRSGRMNGNEQLMHDLLAERGVITIPQQAIGPYNGDLGAAPVSVEILGGQWHSAPCRRDDIIRKTRYVLDAGWHVLMVVVDWQSPITPAQADYVVSYIEQARANPSATREYRMIRRTGEFVAGGSAKDNEISLVSAFAARRNAANGQYETVPR